MSQLENIEAIEKDLWSSADSLRANSELASNEYFLPVMGLLFLRHAYSRYLSAKALLDSQKGKKPSRGGVVKEHSVDDYKRNGALFLPEAARFDYLLALPDSENLATAITQAMTLIEEQSKPLKGQLPKNEYQSIPDSILKDLLGNLNSEVIQQASGDIFGRIYEYFLTAFADQGAHDNGEFFTPVSLVQLIVNIIEPDHGKVFDPACGSGGMFVQSAHFTEKAHKQVKDLTFFGHEKNKTTARLARMNLAVHGLEGHIKSGDEGITYYNDHHTIESTQEKLFGNVDFVMANPPFNVDEVDEEQVKPETGDGKRLPFGLPSVNKKKKISNANYLWIQYFYSYLNEQGRAGFVMSSQASSAGGDEVGIRESLIKSGHVDAMVDISENFFYTRAVPCQLWFFDKQKQVANQDQVLMLDARKVYRQVTRKIRDFNPEQLQNLTAIMWLHRGEQSRFIGLLRNYLNANLTDIHTAFLPTKATRGSAWYGLAWLRLERLLNELNVDVTALDQAYQALIQQQQTLKTKRQKIERLAETVALAGIKAQEQSLAPLLKNSEALLKAGETFHKQAQQAVKDCLQSINKNIVELTGSIVALSETATTDQAKTTLKLEKQKLARLKKDRTAVNKQFKLLEQRRPLAQAQLQQIPYFHEQVIWLLKRFPDADYQDVEGLVKRVSLAELEANDWKLSPSLYVGVAAEEVDENFDFAGTMQAIHAELAQLNQAAEGLAKQIQVNFEGLGV